MPPTPSISSNLGEAKCLDANATNRSEPPEGTRSQEQLPDYLREASRFKSHFWISPLTDRIEVVPWQVPGFTERLREAARESMEGQDFPRLWLVSRAAERLDDEPVLPSEVVESLAVLAANPRSLIAGRRPGRTSELRDSIQLDSLDEPRWRVRLFLAAVRPGLEARLTPDEVDYLVDRAAFEHGALAEVISGLLKLGALGLSPASTLSGAV